MFLNRQKKDVVNSKGPQSSSAKSQGRHSRWGKGFYLHFLGSKITVDGDCSHEIKRHLLLGRKARTNLHSVLKNMYITLLTKVDIVQAMVSPVDLSGCERWTIKKVEHQRSVAFWTVVLAKTIASPSCCKEIKPVNPKGNRPWIVIGRTDAEPEAPILWLPDASNSSLEKTLIGKYWGQEEKRRDRGWDGWTASSAHWTVVSANSGR